MGWVNGIDGVWSECEEECLQSTLGTYSTPHVENMAGRLIGFTEKILPTGPASRYSILCGRGDRNVKWRL